MKERPILFSSPMVRALLDGSKTQTRRALRVQPLDILPFDGSVSQWVGLMEREPNPKGVAFHCRLGQPGDRIWVRESGWQRPERTSKMMREGADTWEPYYYDADGYANTHDKEQFKEWGFKRRPSIHMPRWASRITLEITAVRVERLQDISYEDALAEGAYDPAKCPLFPHTDKETPEQYARRTKFPQRWYSTLWEEINGAGSWKANPWVWVVEFKKLQEVKS